MSKRTRPVLCTRGTGEGLRQGLLQDLEDARNGGALTAALRRAAKDAGLHGRLDVETDLPEIEEQLLNASWKQVCTYATGNRKAKSRSKVGGKLDGWHVEHDSWGGPARYSVELRDQARSRHRPFRNGKRHGLVTADSVPMHTKREALADLKTACARNRWAREVVVRDVDTNKIVAKRTCTRKTRRS